ncbi:MAG: hypothetical protein GVY13_02740, partial [Alphaproteobacteria bacterium]|nr:hypothetical protein [Alphaproteobacteria bacterium]
MQRQFLNRVLAGTALAALLLVAVPISANAQPADPRARPGPVAVPGLPFAVPTPPVPPAVRRGEDEAPASAPIAETTLGWTPPLPPRRGDAAGEAPVDDAGPEAAADPQDAPEEPVPAPPDVAVRPPVADGRSFTPPLPPRRGEPGEEAG